MKIRALYVDTRLKEFTTGPAHDVTDRLFVVRRMFRLYDTLPDETSASPRWQWQPTRVTFQPDETQKLTYSVRGHAVDVVMDADDEEDGE